MKITDTLGRSLSVDLVIKAPLVDGWMEPLGYNLTDSATQFLRVPEGPFALRVMSKLGADLLIHLNGRLLLAAKVPKGIQYLECDRGGKPFFFGAQDSVEADDSVRNLPVSDDGNQNIVRSTAGDGAAVQPLDLSAPLQAPAGDGVLFVVACFADDPLNGFSQAPRQEFTATFQLRTPEEHDKSLAGSLSKMVQPALADQPDAVFEDTRRPHFICSCTGCTTGKGHAH